MSQVERQDNISPQGLMGNDLGDFFFPDLKNTALEVSQSPWWEENLSPEMF